MVLFVGLIPFNRRDRKANRRDGKANRRDRKAFQEFDIKVWFDAGAKRAMVLDHAARASEIASEAMFALFGWMPRRPRRGADHDR